MTLIQPVQSDDTLIGDIRAKLTDGGEHIDLWWLGQSGFLMAYQGNTWLFDPYLSDSLTAKYAGTDKPHIRMTARCVAPASLDMVNVVSSSHRHTDHLDAETLIPILESNPQVSLVVPTANLTFSADRLGRPAHRFTPIDAGETLPIGRFRVTAVPAAHEDLEAEGSHFPCLGYVVQAGKLRVYHSGDTVWYPTMVEWLAPLGVDVAILPINGRKPERRVAGNLWGDEAARLARSIGARCVIPCHYEMFTFNTESPERFVAACRELQQPYHILRCGEHFRFKP